MTNRYRKLPVEIEAVQFDGTPQSVLAVMHFVDAGRTEKELRIHADSDPAKSWIGIPTLEGTMRADAGDWIIRGVKGELYPCKPDVFAVTYEAAAVSAAVAPPTQAADGLRAQLLHAIDHAYTTGVLGYTTPEDLLAAYDNSRTPATDQAVGLRATLREVLDTFSPMKDTHNGPVAYYDGSAEIEPEQYDRWRAVLDDAMRRMADETATETPQPSLRDQHRAAWHALTPDQQTTRLAELDAIDEPAAGARQDGAQP